MIRRISIPAIAIGAALGFATLSSAQPQQRPATRVLGCLDGGCHGETQAYPFLHGPNAIGACDACHEYQDPERHTFVNKRPGSALCSFCHVGADAQIGDFAHEPFARGECAGCHNPHGATDKRFLRAGSVAATCLGCHTQTVAESHVHTPVAQGECLVCHLPHSADFPRLLTMPAETICTSCHESVKERIDTAAVVHKPVATGACTDCHDAHASASPDQLVLAPRALCTSCHETQALEAASATFKHDPMFDDQACLHCHQPHGGPHVALLKDDPIGACLECHARPIELDDGRTIASVAEIAKKGMHPHGSIAEERCTGCHLPHGADHRNLLVRNYSDKFYEPFDISHYQLCFQCHDQRLVLEQTTEVTTDFRNGDKNLHYVHVRSKKNGISCRACHAVHASASDRLIAESVPYGQWSLPLNHQRTPTGGQCNAGCHRTATYDRVTPTLGIEVPEPPAQQTPADSDPIEDPPAGADQSSG
ncbi:MAG: hypothetical protein H6813_06825 [Phycisphaeraceae bacterium]|nr:hypothetical protein [Phycisphaeraceae bacterium]MCB9848648.1 hypothetical protein [Phycisphaeraceae bacterium]